MGRFATTVARYEAFRPPYPPQFSRNAAERLGLSKQHALIDLGTGPGLLALGFAPYVGRITGVDPEPAMLAAARIAAERAAQPFTLIEGRAEDLTDDIGSFDLVTIGRALHWMDRDATLARLERLVVPEGAIAVCSSQSVADGRNPWLDDYNAARRTWSETSRWSDATNKGERTHRRLAAFFEGTRFCAGEVIRVETSHEISVHDLAQRVLTFSSSSPELLGDKVDAMLRDVEQRLLPSSRGGVVTEIVASIAQVVRWQVR
jgi:SAM-dependent methyltransferase